MECLLENFQTDKYNFTLKISLQLSLFFGLKKLNTFMELNGFLQNGPEFYGRTTESTSA